MDSNRKSRVFPVFLKSWHLLKSGVFPGYRGWFSINSELCLLLAAVLVGQERNSIWNIHELKMVFQRRHELLASFRPRMCVRVTLHKYVWVTERERCFTLTDKAKTFKTRASLPWTAWEQCVTSLAQQPSLCCLILCFHYFEFQWRDPQKHPYLPWSWLQPHERIYPTLERENMTFYTLVCSLYWEVVTSIPWHFHFDIITSGQRFPSKSKKTI